MYETLEELLSHKILFVTEGVDSYYVKLDEIGEGDSVWAVDKKTLSVSYMLYPCYFVEIEDVEDLKTVDPEDLRKLIQ